jgi:hypothetical protein
MPRFYFHLDDGRCRMSDQTGMVLPDAEAAWYQGVRSALDLIRESVDTDGLRPGRRFEIENEQGEPVWALPFEEVAGLAF